MIDPIAAEIIMLRKSRDDYANQFHRTEAERDQLRQHLDAANTVNAEVMRKNMQLQAEVGQLRQRVANFEIVQNAAMGVSGRIKRWAADLGRNASDETGELEYVEQAVGELSQRMAELADIRRNLLQRLLIQHRDNPDQLVPLIQRMFALPSVDCPPQPAPAAQGVDNGWRPIEEAPRDGTEVLAFREDAGIFIASYTSCDAFLPDSELEKLDEEAIFAKDWFCADFLEGQRLEADLIPTHWKPLPEPPK